MSETRQRILDASVALVEEQGVRAVSFREVARRAGVSHQSPYHHFGNHHGILRAIAIDGFNKLATTMRAAAEQHDDPLDALVAAGVAYVRHARTHIGHFRVMFDRALVSIHDPDAPVLEAEATHAALVEFVTHAHAAGHGAHLPLDVLVVLCWSTVHGLAVFLVEGVLDAKTPLQEADQDALTAAVVRGLGGLLRT